MRRIGLLVLPDFHVLALTTLSVFEVANKEAGERLYDLHVLSESGGPVRASLGIDVATGPIDASPYDTVLIGVGMEVPVTSPGIVQHLRRSAGSTRRLASICLGSYVLGDAGLLEGRRATTHWLFAADFAARFPRCRVEIDRIFIEDGPFWTSAGMTAGIDLAVGLIERDHGAALARKVARGMVMNHRRAGGQSQHSALLDLDTPNDRIQTALAHARRNLRDPLSIEDLARAACLSVRQFTRLFRAETGLTPARAIERLRLEAARFMLDQSRLPIEDVARETGFGNRERMRRAFLRAFGEAPQAIRGGAGPIATMGPDRHRPAQARPDR